MAHLPVVYSKPLTTTELPNSATTTTTLTTTTTTMPMLMSPWPQFELSILQIQSDPETILSLTQPEAEALVAQLETLVATNLIKT